MTGPTATIRRDSRRPQGVFWPQLLATLLLLPALLWVSAYLWLGSSAGQEQIARWLARYLPAESVSFERARWGPRPDHLELLGARVVDPQGRPLVDARRLDARLRLGELVAGRPLIERLEVSDLRLLLAWDREGHLSLTTALGRERPAGARPPSEVTSPPRRPPPLRVDEIALDRVSVHLRWPTWGLDLEDVTARGRLSTQSDEGLEIDAQAKAGRSGATWGRGRSLRFDAVSIDGFRWRGDGFSVNQLSLLSPGEGSAATIEARLSFDPTFSLRAEGDLRLSRDDAEALLPGHLPRGARADGVALAIDEGKIGGHIGELAAPLITLGPLRLEGARLPIKRLSFAEGLLHPSGSLEITGAHADRVSAPEDVGAEGVDIEQLTVTVRSKSRADLRGVRIDMLSLPGGRVGTASGHGELSFGLTGGKLSGELATGQGTLSASGKLGLNPLSGQLNITTRVTIDSLEGALAETLLAFIPARYRGLLTTPLSGYAIFKTKLKRTKREGEAKRRWAVRTRVREAHLGGREPLAFDGERWTEGRPEEAASP